MGFFDHIFSQTPVPSGAPSPDQPRELALYAYDACPYCQRVYRVMAELELDIEKRDTLRDPARRAELRAQTGRTQVPCLFIDGQPLFESADIVAWLREYRRNTSAGAGSE